jgi:dipeptidyl aminopeptidase/acylaminoacyl peptidase
MSPSKHSSPALILSTLVLLLATVAAADSPAELDFARLAALRQVTSVELSPDGRRVAHTLIVPRRPGHDEDGPAWIELHVVPFEGGESRAYVHGDVRVSQVRFTPDARYLTYVAKRGDDEEPALWAIPVGGGESRKLLTHDEGVGSYRVSPDGSRVAFVAREPESKQHEKLKKKGYKQEVFEEDWRARRVWIAPMPSFTPQGEDPSVGNGAGDASEPQALDIPGSVFNLEWSPDGKRLALAVAPRPLIDDQYMFQRVHVVEADGARTVATLANPGKLGKFAFGPDGRHVAMISAADPNDPSPGRLMVALAEGGGLEDLMPDFDGQVRDLAWQDAGTLMFVAGVGVETIFGEVDLESRARKVHTRSGDGSPVLIGLSLSDGGRRAAFVGQTPTHPSEVFVMAHGQSAPTRLTNSNPWLDGVALARQEVARWKARDGMELEGVLIHPLSQVAGTPAPLLLMVHGGPEGHDRNGWVTRYSRPGQIAAARGYAVLYPNYRGSTAYGVAFSKAGQSDAGGKEFDDLVDAIEYLVSIGVADRDRVGITGGSYGGYATAWCGTRHTEYFRAGVMFVGISNKITKALTTEIPLEDKMVHTRFDPWTKWQFSLERSPIYYAERARTAMLIAGGTKDSRVDPAQSLQFYRALKLIGKTPVRYIRYPGEGHGNRNAAARDDYARRLMRWMDHFVKDKQTDLPPWELEIDLGDDDDEDDEEEEND